MKNALTDYLINIKSMVLYIYKEEKLKFYQLLCYYFEAKEALIDSFQTGSSMVCLSMFLNVLFIYSVMQKYFCHSMLKFLVF